MDQALIDVIAKVKKEFVNTATVEKLRTRCYELKTELIETESKLKNVEGFDAVAIPFVEAMIVALGKNLTPELLLLNLRVKLGARDVKKRSTEKRSRKRSEFAAIAGGSSFTDMRWRRRQLTSEEVLHVMKSEPLHMGDISRELTKQFGYGSELQYRSIRSVLKSLIANDKVRVQGTSKKNTTYVLVAA